MCKDLQHIINEIKVKYICYKNNITFKISSHRMFFEFLKLELKLFTPFYKLLNSWQKNVFPSPGNLELMKLQFNLYYKIWYKMKWLQNNLFCSNFNIQKIICSQSKIIAFTKFVKEIKIKIYLSSIFYVSDKKYTHLT